METDWKQIATLLATALSTIDDVISEFRNRGDEDQRLKRAADALTTVGAIVNTVKAGKLDHLDADLAERDLARLRSALAGNDAKADAAVDEKFDTTDT